MNTAEHTNPLGRLRQSLSLAIKQARCRARDRRTRNFVVSFPKTGRTWLRVMLGHALAQRYGIPEDRVLDTYRISRNLPSGAVRFSHGGPLHLFDPRPYQELTFDHALFHGKRVVHLIRDLRDTLVSYYFQVFKREKFFSGDLGAFLRDPCYGAPKLVRFYTLWFQNQHLPEAFLLQRYEALRTDAAGRLTELLDFLGVDGPLEELARSAAEYGSFENMRRLEAGATFDRAMLKPGDPADQESFKTRKGKVGGYVEYLGVAEQQYLAQVVAELGDPTCDWYYASQ